MPQVLQQSPDGHLAAALADHIVKALKAADRVGTPFPHWILRDLLPEAVCRQVLALPLAPPPIADTHGKRDSHNDVRQFASVENRRRFPVLEAIATSFQDPAVVQAVETTFAIDCTGSYLRIEYCQDRDGFWLEPHVDIKEKLITLQIYLNIGDDAVGLGTDLYDMDKRPVTRSDGRLGSSFAFLPKQPGSWHGFERRPIGGIRRSLIVNYVTDDWRARHELSFPEQKLP